ncbi:MAG: efflux RND transporter periplasmic adaptor subunit [Nitrolancea sp.]
MNRRRWLIAATLILVITAIAAGAVYVLTQNGNVRTATVQRGSLSATIQTTGRLAAKNPIAVRSNASGKVQTIAVSPGDSVKKGDVLAQLDRTPFDDAIDRAQKQLENAEAALNLAEVNAGSDPTPQQTADKLGAAQNLTAAKQELANARDQLANSLILAPVDGTIIDLQTARDTPLGQGSTVVDMANLSELNLSVDVDEVDFPHVQTGMSVTFRLDAYPGTEIDGTITNVSPVAQTSGGTTTFPATITFQTPKGMDLRPGMNANVTIKTAVRENVLLVPESALRTVGQRTFVTVLKNGKQSEVEIQIGLRSNGMVEIASGLSEGQKIVLH